MYIEKRKKYLKIQRIKESVFIGLISGVIIGISFSSIASIRSLTDGLFTFFLYGGISGVLFSYLRYSIGSEQYPEELYIKCKIKEFDDRDDYRDVIIDAIEISNVHESIILLTENQSNGNDGYVCLKNQNSELVIYTGKSGSVWPVVVKPNKTKVITI